jgi:hypothetical protein
MQISVYAACIRLMLMLLCCGAAWPTRLPIQASLPTISSDIKAFVLTQAQLNLDSNSVQHLRCQQGQLKRPPSRWPKAWPSSQLQFQPTDAAAWQQAQSRCNHTYQGLSVAIERGTPLKHFGHR